MIKNKRIGYARVSTAGQNLESQIQTLEKENCEAIFQEKFTGTNKDRPQFKKLMKELKEGDTLIITKLDRLARSTRDALEIIGELFERGVKVHVLNMGLIEDTNTGKLIFTIMSGFAEFERNMIVERTQEGKAIARQNPDYKEGRPRTYSNKQINHALKLKETHSYKQVTELTGISKPTLIRAKKRKELQDIK